MTAPSCTCILAWSLPEEPEFARFADGSWGEALVVPLRLPAWRSAERLFGPERLVDVSDLVPAGERQALYLAELERLTRIRARLVQRDAQPWLACHDEGDLFLFLYAVAFWRRALGRLRERGCERLKLYGPFSRGAVDEGASLVEVDVLDALVRDGAAGGSAPSPAGWRSRLAAGCGEVVNRFAHRLSVATVPLGDEGPPRPWALCGFQNTDAVAQEPLVRHLAASGITDFHWLAPEGSGFAVSEDERQAGDDVPALDDVERRYPADGASRPCVLRWKHPRLAALSDAATARRLLDAVDQETPDLGPALRRTAAEVLRRSNRDLRLLVQGTWDILDAVRPRVLAGHSTIGAMQYARAWARSRGCRFLRFPHGIEYLFQWASMWDADRLAVMGEDPRRRLLEVRPDLEGRVDVVGGMHLLAQMEQDGGAGEARLLANPWKGCLLLSVSLAYGFPDTFGELGRDLALLARAVAAAGGRLWLRCHREKENALYRLLADDVRRAGAEIEVSDPMGSLNRELAASKVVLVRSWGGAAVKALHAGVPLVAWTPRPGQPESDRILADAPLRAGGEDELRTCLERALGEGRDEVLREQRRFLERHLDAPEAPAFERASDLLRNETEDR